MNEDNSFINTAYCVFFGNQPICDYMMSPASIDRASSDNIQLRANSSTFYFITAPAAIFYSDNYFRIKASNINHSF